LIEYDTTYGESHDIGTENTTPGMCERDRGEEKERNRETENQRERERERETDRE
jgi:hypothetical protein